MSGLEGFAVERIDNPMAFEVIVKFHYLHRRPVAPLRAFGLFSPMRRIVGAMTFGALPSMAVHRGVCGPDEADHVVELSRLWVADEVPKNGESFFIGAATTALRAERFDRDIIVSYADSAAGHSGTVYRATNFLFTGTSIPMRDPVPLNFPGHRLSAGKTTHLREWYRTHVGDPTGKTTFDFMEAKYGAGNVGWVHRSLKNRYVLLNGWNRRRRAEQRRALRWPVLPYPITPSRSDPGHPATLGGGCERGPDDGRRGRKAESGRIENPSVPPKEPPP